MEKTTFDETVNVDPVKLLESYPPSNFDFAKEELKTLEEALHIHLCGLNRHDRRAYLAKQNRKAGKRREKALTQRNAP